MRNIWRALKFALPYSTRFVLSVVCALGVSLCWGGNLSSIGVVLEMLQSDQSLQDILKDKLEQLRNDLIPLDEHAANLRRDLIDLERNPLAKDPHTPLGKRAMQLRRDLDNAVDKVQDQNDRIAWRMWLQRFVVDRLPRDKFKSFVVIMVAILLAVAVKGIFDFGQEVLVAGVVNRTLFDVRTQCFRALIHQDTKQLSEIGTSEIMSRLTNDMETLGQGLKTLLGRLIVEPFKAIVCLVAACWISWQLTLVFAILVPLAMITLHRISRMMKRAARKLLERMSQMYQILRESFEGIRVVKAFTMEPYERRRFRKAAEEYARKSQQVSNMDAFAGPFIELLGMIALLLALTTGAYLVINGERRILGLNMRGEEPLSFTLLLTLYTLLIAVADPVRKLSSVYTKIQTGETAAERIFALFDKLPTVTANPDGPIVPRHAKSIEFKNVTFSYTPGNETPTLNSVSLTVKAGETIAIVGPNGCGKSTLLGFLPRFYDPDIGTVVVDGVNLRTANLRRHRKQVGVVTQHTVLFQDTIANNIAYGKPGAKIEDVVAAAKKAFAHEFIEQLPNGYDTILGEAWKPSGGQEQRIALARAILRNPSILILDEFTSQIDPESEQKIHLAIREFVKGRTTFLITHRMANLDVADRIVVMDAGQIVAVGTHSQLMTSCSLYQRLYDSQMILRAEAA